MNVVHKLFQYYRSQRYLNHSTSSLYHLRCEGVVQFSESSCNLNDVGKMMCMMSMQLFWTRRYDEVLCNIVVQMCLFSVIASMWRMAMMCCLGVCQHNN